MRRKVLAVGSLMILSLLAFSASGATDFNQITLADIMGMSLSADPLDGSDNQLNRIPTGTVLVYLTDEGRYGVLEIASYGQDLALNWRTYRSDGTVYSSGTGLVVRASYTCDLDAGAEGAASADFQWHHVTGVERYLEPRNGASFAVVQPTATIFTPTGPAQSGKAPAPVPSTGQVSCFPVNFNLDTCCPCATGAWGCDPGPCPEGQDGQLRRGEAWPVPRFTDNDDGTITDNLTGLIWLRAANCFQTVDWEDALHQVSRLQDGMCGLGDGSGPGDWRLPNVREMQSLIRYGLDERTFHTGGAQYALPNMLGTGKYQNWDPFIDVHWGLYWTSTTYADGGLTIDMQFLTYKTASYWTRNPDACTAWCVDVRDGRVFGADKFYCGKSNDYLAVWPVRDAGTSTVPRTGQAWCYEAPSGGYSSAACSGLPEECGHGNLPADQDGDLQAGVPWPVPRFTDNADGTVTDNLTGLIWLKNANCFGERTWFEALDLASSLRNGECGLSDGSVEGDWRLPNVLELQSLVHFGFVDPAVPDTLGQGKCQNGDPFLNVQSWFYWTSTTYEICSRTDPDSAWCVNMFDGHLASGGGDAVDCYAGSLIFTKNHRFLVWPVRGG